VLTGAQRATADKLDAMFGGQMMVKGATVAPRLENRKTRNR